MVSQYQGAAFREAAFWCNRGDNQMALFFFAFFGVVLVGLTVAGVDSFKKR